MYFLNKADSDMSFVHHATEVAYVRRNDKRLRRKMFSGNSAVDLSRCRLPRPIASIFLICKGDT